ncbi:MAG: transposase, partial [Spirochaetes bacterium]|nr:transposase [Spirochaetota bacterium]
MRDATFFTKPEYDWQRRYEALRASFVDQLPAKVIADRFDYTPAYIRLLKHLFKHEKIELSEPVSEGKAVRRRVSANVRQKIRIWRERQLSATEITQLLSEEGVEISVRTVERVLIEEGFSKLTRRTRIKVGLTVKGTEAPARSEPIYIDQINGQRFGSPGAGVFLFVPFLAQLNI